jgi:y4mF family transcriptional regulator
LAPALSVPVQKTRRVVRYPTQGNAMRALLGEPVRKDETRTLPLTARLLETRRAPSEATGPSNEAKQLVLKRVFNERPIPPEPPAQPDIRDVPQLAPTRVKDVDGLAQLVRIRRQMLRLSQHGLADKANVGRRFIYDLEAGKPTLELGKTLLVCRVLGISLTAQVEHGR